MFSMAAAKTALKRKKLAESNLETTQSHINTLETQMNAVETANLNVETLKVMKSASDAMRKMQGEMDVDKVDSVVYVAPSSHLICSLGDKVCLALTTTAASRSARVWKWVWRSTTPSPRCRYQAI